MAYYDSVIGELLELHYGLVWLTHDQHAYGVDSHRLEVIREYAAREQAYVYYQLLTRRIFLREIAKIRHYQSMQKRETKAFLANLPEEGHRHFGRIVHKKTQEKVQTFRKEFFQYRLTYRDAPKWFAASAQWIGELDTFSSSIIDDHFHAMVVQHRKSQRELWWIVAIGGAALLTFFFLVYMLNMLLSRVEALLDDLRVASFAFASHEAMAITDVHGNILKVNKAFTAITGYTEKEVKGRNPNILQSGNHTKEFYQAMWQELLKNGHWRGEIQNRRKNGELYDEQLSITAIKDADRKTTHYISHFLDISDLKKAEAEARHQATHDFLTQLPNRKSMMTKLSEEYSRAQRHHYYDAFLFIDLDDFKKINDVYGHATGDQLLREVAQRIQDTVRAEDYTARISGDEFCVILMDLGNNKQEVAGSVSTVCAKLLHKLEQPYLIDRRSLNISASFGVKIFPDGDQAIETVISSADTAMYQAKDRGKNRFVFYDNDVEWRVRELAQMGEQLRTALEAGEGLVFYFQPKVDVATEAILGAELLVRWQHPTRGLLYPDTFLEAISNISMMPKLSEMALEAACRFMVENAETFTGTLAINATAYELRTDLFVQKTQEVIRRHGIDPSRIEIEILENDLIEDFDAVVDKMNVLKAFGLEFSIDDFGVGYSSINYLHSLPVDTLKIDRDFVIDLHEPKTQALVKVIIQFAKVFGLKTILEGIDELYQLEFARENGVEMYQGYYFSQAVDEKTFANMLAEKKKSN